MYFLCPECQHRWEAPAEAGQQYAQCPECFQVIPVVLAKTDAPPESLHSNKPPRPDPVDLHAETISPHDAKTLHDASAGADSQPKSALLGCPQCGHCWESNGETHEQAYIQCPECFAPIPCLMAKREGARIGKASAAKSQKSKFVPPNVGYERPVRREPQEPPQSLRSEAQSARSFNSTGKTHVEPDIHERDTLAQDQDDPGQEYRELVSELQRFEDRWGTGAGGDKANDAPLSGDAPTMPQERSRRRNSVKKSTGTLSPVAQEMSHLIGQTLGGFQLLEILGAGGMGAVFLARQISLDRLVALKVLPGRFASDPDMQARFMREALSTAQLNHHNAVQIFDVGSDQGWHFICMEYVKGKSLSDLIKQDGSLSIEKAAGYVLQAARGLKYAHDKNIIHRDIKPGNLMLNDQGLVKVADMGLAKMIGDVEGTLDQRYLEQELKKAGPDLTLSHKGLGTPAYMPPEQAQHANKVDQRADQYSLGCTLYYLCTGQAPYSGTTAFEVISKHMNDPVVPLETRVRNCPPRFSSIVERMVQKKPEDRFPGMADVVTALESFLGLDDAKGGYSPRDQHLNTLTLAQDEYYAASLARMRALLPAAFFLAVAALMIFFMGFYPLRAVAALGLLTLTPLCNFVIGGMLKKSYFFRRVRSLFFDMTLKGWFYTISIPTVTVVGLWHLGWLPYWIGMFGAAAGIAAAYQFTISRGLRKQREPALRRGVGILRDLRMRGLSEEKIQEFICRYSGVQWEEFFEDLFGYEAMIEARVKWAQDDPTNPRKSFALWRDPLARWLDAIDEKRRVLREEKAIQRVEMARLKAEGVSEKVAQREAKRVAQRFVSTDLEAKRDIKPMLPRIRRMRFTTSFHFLFLASRMAVGLAMVTAFLAQYSENAADNVFIYQYYDLGYGETIFGLIAGILLFVSSFSVMRKPPALIMLGALLLVFQVPVVSRLQILGVPLLPDPIPLFICAGLIVCGFGLCLLSKLSGGRF